MLTNRVATPASPRKQKHSLRVRIHLGAMTVFNELSPMDRGLRYVNRIDTRKLKYIVDDMRHSQEKLMALGGGR